MRTITNSGVIRFDLSKLKAKIALINSCNVKPFEMLILSKGRCMVLDVRPYIELLNDLSVFYTVSKV